MNWVVTGRKMGESSAAGMAKAAVSKTGADAIVPVLSPA